MGNRAKYISWDMRRYRNFVTFFNHSIWVDISACENVLVAMATQFLLQLFLNLHLTENRFYDNIDGNEPKYCTLVIIFVGSDKRKMSNNRDLLFTTRSLMPWSWPLSTHPTCIFRKCIREITFYSNLRATILVLPLKKWQFLHFFRSSQQLTYQMMMLAGHLSPWQRIYMSYFRVL